MTANHEDGYVMVGRNRNHSFGSNNMTKPTIRRSGKGLYLAQEIYEEIGSPESVIVYFNLKDKMIKLLKPSEGGPPVRSYKVKNLEYMDGTRYHLVRLSSDKSLESLIASMPVGHYISIGGGAYSYHGARAPLK